MSKSTPQKQKISIPLKKIFLPLLLLGLLSYLGVSTFIIDKGDGISDVQQAEAMVIKADDTADVDPVAVSETTDTKETTQYAAPTEPVNPFIDLQNLDSIPIPAPIVAAEQNLSSDDPADSETSSLDIEAPGEITVFIEPAPEQDPDPNADPNAEGNSDAIEPDSLTLIPTYSWVNAFSAESVFNGVPLPIGSVVTAYDPDGVLIGRAIVKSTGEYGAMALYMDDPSTTIDEGAVEGDLLEFKINGFTAVVLGPSNPIWTENGTVLVLNLASGNLSG